MGDYKGGSVWPAVVFLIVILVGLFVVSELRDPIPDDMVPVPPSMTGVR